MTGALGGYRLTRSRNLKRSKNSETLAWVEVEFWANTASTSDAARRRCYFPAK
jgi:hypothetical protein